MKLKEKILYLFIFNYPILIFLNEEHDAVFGEKCIKVFKFNSLSRWWEFNVEFCELPINIYFEIGPKFNIYKGFNT